MGKKVTIADIANETGFSPATVSRALSQKELVNTDTYDLIIDAVKRLGYKTSKLTLAAKKSAEPRILVINVSDASNSFYSRIFEGIRASAANCGWSTMVNQDPINAATLPLFSKMLKNCNAVGLIVMDLVPTHILDELLSILPVVQCCEFDSTAKAPYVGIDNYSAALNMVDYLIRQGHQKIAILNGPLNLKSEQERQRGYIAALERVGIAPNPNYMIRLPASEYFIAYTSTKNLLQTHKSLDAIFAVADVLAFAAINAAKELGYSVPRDISIAGFDNIIFSEMSNPKISTINQPCFEIGFLSAETIRKQCDDVHNVPQSILVNTELILRESTC